MTLTKPICNRPAISTSIIIIISLKLNPDYSLYYLLWSSQNL